ncbi:MAG: hypothetical protein Q8O94_03590 [bacterium]|nr:hypothetical protein [bacterium]
MALEKARKLRTMEFTFTDGCVHPVCHCEYHDIITDDGVEIARTVHRECSETMSCREQLLAYQRYEEPLQG